jgi:hypothetical protein
MVLSQERETGRLREELALARLDGSLAEAVDHESLAEVTAATV